MNPVNVNSNLQRVCDGALAGVIATGAMSLLMLLAQRSTPVGKLPPRKIVEAGMEAATEKPPEQGLARFLSVPSHFAFGAAAGALFGWFRHQLPRQLSPVWPGIAYGLAVWAVSYKGWIPALRILPPPEHDRPARAQTMVAAHVVFGSVLGALLERGSLPDFRRATKSAVEKVTALSA